MSVWIRFFVLFASLGLCQRSLAAVELKEAEITTIKNIVQKDEGSGAQPAKTNDKIYEKAKVTTAAASMAELTFVDSSITRMGANTLFSFQSKERLIKLDQGTVLIHTPSGNGGATVDCGGVTASVTGTTFMASRDTVGNSVFVLLEGAGGMKITTGGSTTTIRAGQAASVGAAMVNDAGGKSEEKTTVGAKADASGGGKESVGAKSSDTTGKPNIDNATPGGGKTGGDTVGATGVGEAKGGMPAAVPMKMPEIKVFDVDVKKIVQTTPLITGFTGELPSMKKIDATIQVQQEKVAGGKTEKLEVEVVAIAEKDGDFLVGAPTMDQADMKVVNSKEAVAEKVTAKVAANGPGQGSAGDGLDIATAAGPGAGGNNSPVASTPPPKVDAPAPPLNVLVTSPVNPAQTVVQQPTTPSLIAVTAKVNDDSRPYNQANPGFGFSITSGALLTGHSLVTGFLTPATSSSGVAPYVISFSNPRIVDSSGADVTSRYNLTTVSGVLNVLKASPNLNFIPVGSLVFGQAVDLVASALGGGVNYEVVSGPASLVNGKLVVNSGTGSVVVRAVAAGDQNYNGAIAEQTINLGKATQTLNFATAPSFLTGSSVSLPTVSGAQVGAPTFSILETDGRASIDSLGNLQIGKILGADSFTVRATAPGNNNYQVGQQDIAVGITPDASAIYAANPARRLLLSAPTGDELTVLDQFFYYTGKASGVQGPGTFYPTDYQNRFLNLANLGSSVELYPGQAASYYFGSTLGVGSTASTVNLAGKDAVIYANRISLGSGTLASPLVSQNLIQGGNGGMIPDGNAAGFYDSVVSNLKSELPLAVRINLTVDPLLANDAFLGDYVAYLRHTSADGLDTRTVKLFEHIGATTAFPEGSAGTGLSVLMSDWATDSIAPQDPAGILTGTYRPGVADQLFSLNDLGAVDPGGNWTLWVGDTSSGGTGKITSWSIELEQLLQPTSVIDLTGGVGKTFTTAAGDQGLAVNSTWMKANGANLEFLSTSSLEMSSTQMSGVGSQFLAEAVGSVKMGAQSTPAVPSPSVEKADREQVRILADTVTDAGGVAVAPPGSMAVIRTGDSLELRNVTIRNFSETRLEKVDPTTKSTVGRVLISGSAVRDFKIKELVGAAVNADAKIQMAALDAQGKFAGEMKLEGQLPVATQLAGALASVQGKPLAANDASASTPVHADMVDLAAKNITFNNASISAMNSITARANTILVQNSFMTVVRNSGMINMYVSSGMVNQNFGTMMDGRVNFAGSNTFQFGNVAFNISSPTDLSNAYGTKLFDTQNGAGGKTGAINVLSL